jgi:hypothetical protein
MWLECKLYCCIRDVHAMSEVTVPNKYSYGDNPKHLFQTAESSSPEKLNVILLCVGNINNKIQECYIFYLMGYHFPIFVDCPTLNLKLC